MSEIKYILLGLYIDRLDIEEEKISKLKYIVIKTIQRKTKRVSRLTK